MKTYKATLRIPTATYAYMEIQVEGTPEEIVELHDEFMAAYEASVEKNRQLVNQEIIAKNKLKAEELKNK